MFYYTCYLSLYKDGGLLCLNECFLCDEDNETFYYCREKMVKVTWNVIECDDDQYYV